MLKCHTVQWLLLMEGKDIEEEGMKESIAVLETLVPEGTNVRLFIKDPEESLKVFLPFIDKYGVTRWGTTIFQFNSKNPEDAIAGGNPHYLKKDLHRYSLSGRQLTMAIKPSIFIFHLGRANPDGSYELVGGGELVIINALSYALNFTYKAFLSPDNSFGNVYPNGTATGIIGMVARREVTFGATALGITWDREAVVDFTTPYMFQRSLLFSRFPKEKNQALAVLSPYQLQVWISLTASVLFIGPIAYLVSLLGSQCQPAGVKASLQWYSFNMFRNIVVQGNYIEGVSWSVRFILFIWFVFCLIFSALYSGVLTAVLAVPSYETPIDSLTDLPRASQEGFTISLLAGSSYVSLFKFFFPVICNFDQKLVLLL
ncbi:glutamate receptor ionotropic, delta-2-like [Palaemon carinicauda]|uniref:glutamate receptor ionotropic, delta-2-like n=1 Tax=Palaemon carinicauda TaxID=392227 RepID=UPI0035B59200